MMKRYKLMSAREVYRCAQGSGEVGVGIAVGS